jgi:hypothetical protein
MLPNQDTKLSSQSIVAKHGTHDQSSHGKKGGGSPTAAATAPKDTVPDLTPDVISSVGSSIDSAINATFAKFPETEGSRIKNYMSKKNVAGLQSLNRKYAEKIMNLEDNFSESAAENLDAYGRLQNAVVDALQGFGVESEFI